MKKNLLKPLLAGTMSLAMAVSVLPAAAFAEGTDDSSAAVTYAELYASMGIDTSAEGEGYYDAITSATNFSSHHAGDIKAGNTPIQTATDADGIISLTGVRLNAEGEVPLSLDKGVWSTYRTTANASKKYGTDKFTIYPAETEGYDWDTYRNKVYAVTIAHEGTTIGAMPWIDFYTEDHHFNQVEIAINYQKVAEGVSNGATVHRFDTFYDENGYLDPGVYTVSVYADGYTTLVSDVTVPTYFDATVTVANADVSATETAVEFSSPMPEDYDAVFAVDGTEVAYADGKITYEALSIGSHTLTITDKSGKYNSLTAAFMVTTDKTVAAYDSAAQKLVAAEGATDEELAAYISAITGVKVNGTNYNPKDRRNPVTVINADGTIDLSKTIAAETTENVTIVVSAAGYPDYEFVYTVKQEKQDSSVTLADKTVVYTGKAAAIDDAAVEGSTGAVTYTYYTDSACTQEIDAAQVVNAGTYYVKAAVEADDNYNAAESNVAVLTITKASQTIKLTKKTVTYNGKAVKIDAARGYQGTGKITYTYYSDKACTKTVKASAVKNAGTYYVKAKIAADTNFKAATSAAVVLKINKAAQSLKVTAAVKTVKYASVKKAAQTVKALTVKGVKTKAVYARVASGSSAKLTINKSTGKITVKKGTAKGTYKIKVKVTAKADANYKAASKTVTVSVKVK